MESGVCRSAYLQVLILCAFSRSCNVQLGHFGMASVSVLFQQEGKGADNVVLSGPSASVYI